MEIYSILCIFKHLIKHNVSCDKMIIEGRIYGWYKILCTKQWQKQRYKKNNKSNAAKAVIEGKYYGSNIGQEKRGARRRCSEHMWRRDRCRSRQPARGDNHVRWPLPSHLPPRSWRLRVQRCTLPTQGRIDHKSSKRCWHIGEVSIFIHEGRMVHFLPHAIV